jgi:hypothetical protein
MTSIVEGNRRSFVAGADLTAKQYYIVKVVSGVLQVATAATDKLLGVLENTPASGELGSVHLRSGAGTLKVKLGGTVNENDAVTSDGSGLGIATSSSGNQILGYALAGGVSGDILEVMPSSAKV